MTPEILIELKEHPRFTELRRNIERILLSMDQVVEHRGKRRIREIYASIFGYPLSRAEKEDPVFPDRATEGKAVIKPPQVQRIRVYLRAGRGVRFQ